MLVVLLAACRVMDRADDSVQMLFDIIVVHDLEGVLVLGKRNVNVLSIIFFREDRIHEEKDACF